MRLYSIQYIYIQLMGHWEVQPVKSEKDPYVQVQYIQQLHGNCCYLTLISPFKHIQTSATSQHILLSILLYIFTCEHIFACTSAIHNLSFSRLCAHAFCSIIPLTGALYSLILHQNQTDIQILYNPELVLLMIPLN
jgi:hypothetical protein